MKKTILAILLISFVPVLLSCSNSKDESLAVAKAFWEAMEARDVEKAKSYATKESANSLQINEDEEDQEVVITFGEVTIEDDKSTIETTMHPIDAETNLEIPLKTVLVLEDGEWKVDFDQTMMSMLGGAMGAMMDAMKEGFEEMGKAMAEEMKAGFEQIRTETSDSEDD